MPRIRLINPRNWFSEITNSRIVRRLTLGRKALFMPLGLCVAAATVPKGWQVEVHDECVEPLMVKADVDVVGITAMTCQAPRAYEIADAYRRIGVPVILGGIHPSMLPQEALEHADAVAVGEAESTMPQMTADFEAGRMAGIYRASGQWHIAAPRRDLLRTKDYLVASAVQTSRGCPHRCRFCTTHAMYAGRYSWRPVEEVMEEIDRLGMKRVFFSDDNLFGNQKWAMGLFEALAKRKIRWGGQASIDIARDEKTLRLVKRSGCTGLIYGLESDSADNLEASGKTYCDAGDYLERIRRTQQAELAVWGSFIFGFEADTVESCRKRVEFARSARLEMCNFTIMTPYPGTELYNDFESQGRLTSRDWSRYNGGSVVIKPNHMTADELQNVWSESYRNFFSWGGIYQRLGLRSSKKGSWLINSAIHGALSHYYRLQRRKAAAPRPSNLSPVAAPLVSSGSKESDSTVG